MEHLRRVEGAQRISVIEIGCAAMTLPSVLYQKGETVFIRATVVDPCSNLFQVRIEDHPHIATTIWVPVSEIAKQEDIDHLPPPRRPDLKYLERKRDPLPK